ncbi:MAG: polyprenyl synthetase family protein, partial [Promethearchaeota archaeon]
MIEDFFKTEKAAINEKLDEFFTDIGSNERDILFNDFIEQLKQFILPKNNKAKRINPILLVAAFSGIINPMYLEDQIDEIRKVAIAIELLHNGHLIHDDLLDNDELRRGNPTFHIQLQNEINKIYKSMNFNAKKKLVTLYGRDLSILGGSLGYL